jgi:hypothetical protein
VFTSAGTGVPAAVPDFDVESDLQCFIVRGEHLTFSVMEDVYFLTGLPFRGTLLPTEPVLPGMDSWLS